MSVIELIVVIVIIACGFLLFRKPKPKQVDCTAFDAPVAPVAQADEVPAEAWPLAEDKPVEPPVLTDVVEPAPAPAPAPARKRAPAKKTAPVKAPAKKVAPAKAPAKKRAPRAPRA